MEIISILSICLCVFSLFLLVRSLILLRRVRNNVDNIIKICEDAVSSIKEGRG